MDGRTQRAVAFNATPRPRGRHPPGRRPGRRGSLLAALALALPLSLRAQPVPPAPAVFDSASLHGLERELASVVRESDVPGVAVALVARDGPHWSAGFGSANVAAGTPVTPGTLFRANSVSKSFVALALLRLHEQGRISLDAPLREVAPEIAFRNPWEARHPVRVVHLLEHTTGFDELHLKEYAFGPEDGSLRDALAVNPAPRTSRWPPGTRMAYNNGAYAVAAHVVERVTGEPFAEHVDREILGPLGMRASGFGLERVDGARMATHYLGATEEAPRDPYPPIIRPAGALVTSADDLAAFVRLLLRRGDPLLGETAVARMETPRTTDAARAGLRVGYGLGSYTAEGAGFPWHGHAGGTPSAFARYAYQPGLGMGYVVLMNGAGADTRRRLEAAIQRFLVAGREAPAPPPARAPAEGALAIYEGFYRQGTANWQLTAGIERLLDVRRVRAGGGSLLVAPILGDVPARLIPAGRDRFRGRGEPEAAAVFLRDGRGAVTGLRTWDADNLRAGNYDRTSALAVYAPLAALAVSLALALSAVLSVPVHVVAAFRERHAARRGLPVRWLPLAAVLSLVAAVVVLVAGVAGEDAGQVLGRPGATAVGFWVLTWAFALLSAAALVVTARALRRRSGMGRAVRVHAFLVSLACTVLALFLASWGIVGLRTWAF